MKAVWLGEEPRGAGGVFTACLALAMCYWCGATTTAHQPDSYGNIAPGIGGQKFWRR